MHLIKILAFTCAFLCINAASNLLQNPGFDEAHSDCNTTTSWSQYNTSNPYSVCPGADWYMVSQPYALYLSGSGWAGAVQTVDVSQTEVTTFNFSCQYWLVSCSQQTCYTTIGWLGTTFDLTYTDGTKDTFEDSMEHGYSTAVFVPHTFSFTPAKPVKTLVITILIEGNGLALSMWDDVSLITGPAATSPTSTPSVTPTNAPTNVPSTVAPTDAPTSTPSTTSTPTNPPATVAPTDAPTNAPSTTSAPTSAPSTTSTPTNAPSTVAPTNAPPTTSTPTSAPTAPATPTSAPTTSTPTSTPSNPTSSPSNPTSSPSNPTSAPTTSSPSNPTSAPTSPTSAPTSAPPAAPGAPDQSSQGESTSSAALLSAPFITALFGALAILHF